MSRNFKHPSDVFYYKKGSLAVENVLVRDIVQSVGTPVYIYSVKALLSPLKELQKNLRGVDALVCFAMKSNSNLSILKLLSDAGAGMDVVSGGELFRALRAGVPARKVVFSGVGKTKEEMIQALTSGQTDRVAGQAGECGIHSFNVESVDELLLLNQVAGELGRKAPVALRFNPDVDPKTHPYISTGLKENKFGLDKKEIFQILKQLNQLPWISLEGISIHIGSQMLSLSHLSAAFAKLKLLIQEITPLLKTPLRFVDLGGGVGIAYREKDRPPSIEKYCELIKKNFGKVGAGANAGTNLRVMIEPGRLIAGNSGALITKVLFRKSRSNKDFIIVDGAMNDLIRPALYESYHEIVAVENANKSPRKKADVVGPVCESADFFAKDRPLPKSLKEGDLLAVLSAGAYGFVMASNYNSRPRPAEVLVDGDQFRVVRQRENLEDLVRGEIL